MEVSNHKGLNSHPFHIELAEEEEEEEEGLVSGLSEGEEVEKVERKVGEAGTVSVRLQKYITISVFFAFSFL